MHICEMVCMFYNMCILQSKRRVKEGDAYKRISVCVSVPVYLPLLLIHSYCLNGKCIVSAMFVETCFCWVELCIAFSLFTRNPPILPILPPKPSVSDMPCTSNSVCVREREREILLFLLFLLLLPYIPDKVCLWEGYA